MDKKQESTKKDYEYWAIPKGQAYTYVYAMDKKGNIVECQQVNIETLLEQERNRIIGLIEEQMMSIGEGNKIMSDYMDVVSNERLENVLKALTNKDN